MKHTPKIEELKAALEAATKGEWGVDSGTHVTKWDFGKDRFGCRSVAQTGRGLKQPQTEENCANATFIALSHNLMPTLLEAVELLRDIEASLKNDTGWSVLKLEAVLEKLK